MKDDSKPKYEYNNNVREAKARGTDTYPIMKRLDDFMEAVREIDLKIWEKAWDMVDSKQETRKMEYEEWLRKADVKAAERSR